MGLRAGRAAVGATLAALVLASSSVGASGAFGATPLDEIVAPSPVDPATGSYIVVLDEEPVATYDGGEPGLPATRPDDGAKLDTHSPAAKKYAAFLEDRQRAVAADAGIEPAATYQVVLNGFSARMDPDAAARVAAGDGVRAVYPDEILRPDAVQDDTVDSTAEAVEEPATPAGGSGGAGVVVGLIDTGISPANPSFAGERLRVLKGPEPYLRANTVVFDKADGRQFRSDRFTGDDWESSDYSTKLIGAQYFASGADAAGFGFESDARSPRDAGGHGSATASIAAGESGVAVAIEGADLGTTSGVAPDARVASYKACYVGPDDTVTSDDMCVGSDVIDAVDQAVSDGVDVIGYPIGGGAVASAWSADDVALRNAALAGVFIAVSAGNAGPGSASAQGGAPWYTTVAASAAPAFSGTVRLSTGFQAPGATVTVPRGTAVTAPVVYAGDTASAASAEAHLCYPGSLVPAAVQGRIVVCDRGTNPREEKSQEVSDAGGVGMILVNPTPDSVDADLHAVPTVHLDARYRDDLLAAIASDGDVVATLDAENATDAAPAPPQIAEFSGRGPGRDAGDVLSPDVAAPGVDILAAAQDGPDGEPGWRFSTGTSMAAAHVAGLAARYLSAHPQALPFEIKSALSTTAGDTVTADGTPNVDPFAQGAGSVDPVRVADPGLLYISGPANRGSSGPEKEDGRGWASGESADSPSIVIGALAQERTVTRTVLATRAGTYEATAGILGLDVQVSPATLTFTAPGEAQEFTVTFTVDSAPLGEWATGFLTWTGVEGESVRSPLAVRPVATDAGATVIADGEAGEVEVAVAPPSGGDVPLTVSGLAPLELLVDPASDASGHSGDASSGDANGNVAWVVEIPEDSPLAEFTLEASDDDGSVALAVYRLTEATQQRYSQRWDADGPSDSRVTLADPAAGPYLVVANVRGLADGATWDLTAAVVPPAGGPGDAPSLTASAEFLGGAGADHGGYLLSWSGLSEATRYLGVVSYGESAGRTIVRIDAGSPPPVTAERPTVSGSPRVGEVLSVEPGTWTPEDVALSYGWLRDGEPILGANAPDYLVSETDLGATLTAEVTAREPGNVNPGVARSDGIVVPVGSIVEATMNRYSGTDDDQFAVTVSVRTEEGATATGTVTVSVDGTEYVGTLADGEVTFELAAQVPGMHVVVIEYAGTEGVDGSTGVSGFVVRR